MIYIYKTVLVFSTLLVSYINLGLCDFMSPESNFQFHDFNTPASKEFVSNDYLLYINLFEGTKNRINPGKQDRISPNIKLWFFASADYRMSKGSKSVTEKLFRNPNFIIRIFSSSDICFPFNYFW